MKRTRGAILAILLLAPPIFVLCARGGILTMRDPALRARYALPLSRFISVNGVPIHLVDQGHGPAIVLIHGSFGSLLDWNDWAAALTDHYRVVRFDTPPMGLSGPDPAAQYDTDADLRILDGIVTQLNLGHFILVATSSGGVLGAAYAATHPDQVQGLVLSGIALGPVRFDRSHFPPGFQLLLRIDPIFAGWQPRLFWRYVLRQAYADPSKVTEADVTRWTALNNRAQLMPKPKTAFVSPFARTPSDLGRLTMPVLLLWSAQDRDLPLAVAIQALPLIGAKDKALVVVPDCGHAMALECGARSVALARPFLDRLTH